MKYETNTITLDINRLMSFIKDVEIILFKY